MRRTTIRPFFPWRKATYHSAHRTESPASRITPPPPVDLWQRIRTGFAMAELDSEKVRSSEDFYVIVPNI